MAKKIGVIINLEDQLTGKFKKTSNVLKNRINSLKISFRSLKSSIKETFTGFIKYIVPQVIGAFKMTTTFFKNSITLYNNSIEQQTKLRSVIANTKGVTKEQVEELIKMGDILEGIGVIGNDVIIAGTQQISTFQLQADTIKKLMPGMADLIAQQKGLNATTGDAVSVGNMIGKVMSGQVGALSRAGIIFNKTQEKILKYGTEQEKAATLAEVLKANVGGVNKALRETPEGTMHHFRNTLVSIQKNIGSKLQPIITKFLNSFTVKLPIIEKMSNDFIEKLDCMIPKLEKLINGLFEYGLIVLEKFLKILCLIAENWWWIKPTIIGITGIVSITKLLILTYQGLKTIVNAVRLAWALYNNGLIKTILLTVKENFLHGMSNVFLFAKLTLMKLLTIATWAFNAALTVLTSPITWIIVGIAALAVGVYLLYKNFDVVKVKVLQLWEMFKNSGPIQTLIGWFKSLLSYIQPVLDIIIKLKDGITGLITGGIDKIKGLFGFGKGVEIPKNAMGTPYFQGGPTMVNERGGELINLPSGSQIIPHDLSKKIVNNKTSNANITININGSDKSSKEIAYEVAAIFNRQLGLQGGNILG